MSASKKGRLSLPRSTPLQRTPRWGVPVICLVLAAITFAVFGQTLRYEFIAFDDNDYVYENPVVSRGLTRYGFLWAFSFRSYNWHPLTWLSHELDCQLYGLHPGGHHLTNVLIHAASSILLFLIMLRLTSQRAVPGTDQRLVVAQASGERAAPAGPSATTGQRAV